MIEHKKGKVFLLPQKTTDEYRKDNVNRQFSTIRSQARELAEKIVYTYEQRQKLNDMAQERFQTGQALRDEALLKQENVVNELLHDRQMCDMIKEIESLQSEHGQPALFEQGPVRNRLREDRVAEVQRRIEQVLMQKSRGGGEGDSR